MSFNELVSYLKLGSSSRHIRVLKDGPSLGFFSLPLASDF